MMSEEEELLVEIMTRRRARVDLHSYITYTKADYKDSLFSQLVCAAIDQFILDCQAGKRPILVLQAPPQHGKSEIVSRRLAAYLMGRFPNWRIASITYSDDLSSSLAQDVRRGLASEVHKKLFPAPAVKDKYARHTITEFNSPGGSGSYLGVGIGGGITGRPVDIGIIDDPTKNETEALSPTTKERHWNWYQSGFTTRLSQNSGQIIMATSWAQDDLVGRILTQYKGNKRLTHLRFPAINDPGQIGFNPVLPLGALVPELHSLEKLVETMNGMSDYWWSALFQQSPKILGGNIFKDRFAQYYLSKDLPETFDKIIASWDCTFKETTGTDYVVGQVWGKKGANSYLLDQVRDRMSFTRTVKEVIAQKKKWPQIREILIEDKANGPAVIDTLKAEVSGIIPIEPDGSKEARAHAVTAYWEALNVWLPHEGLCPWVVGYLAELTIFPAGANDDQVDSTTQALRRLYPLRGRLQISQAALDAMMGKTA